MNVKCRFSDSDVFNLDVYKFCDNAYMVSIITNYPALVSGILDSTGDYDSGVIFREKDRVFTVEVDFGFNAIWSYGQGTYENSRDSAFDFFVYNFDADLETIKYEHEGVKP